jgi:Flp pilus assembly pilin Flp
MNRKGGKMILKFRRFMKGRRGQGMSEYIIMVGLVAIAAIGIYTAFGKQVRHAMNAIGAQLSGEISANQTKEGTLESQDTKDNNLGSFGN